MTLTEKIINSEILNDLNDIKINPSLGLIPRYSFDADKEYERIMQIFDAIKRYSEEDKKIPKHWIDELIERLESYKKMSTSIVKNQYE